MQELHNKLEIADFATLNALNRVLIAAKFQLDPVDRDVPGSPLVADLANLVADLCAEHIVREGLVPAEVAQEWRKPGQHPGVLEVVRARIRECEPWSSWTEDERQDYVRLLLAPYFPAPDTVRELVEHGQAHHGAA